MQHSLFGPNTASYKPASTAAHSRNVLLERLALRAMMPMVVGGKRLKASRIVSSRPLDRSDCHNAQAGRNAE